MPMEEEPVVGAIYQDPDGVAFEVVSFDEDDGTIEVQYEDGEVGEIDIDAWYEMELQQLRTADPDEEEEETEPEKVDKRALVEDDDADDVDEYDDDDNDDDYNN